MTDIESKTLTIKDLIRRKDALENSRSVQLAIREKIIRQNLVEKINQLEELDRRGKAILDAGVDVDLLYGSSSYLE
ncbi:MAG: hypothetical protein IK104_01335 [Clostridia bacterium]|nr:hypothetical protein [Clostridia bacterium]